jgi:hypothetical protein
MLRVTVRSAGESRRANRDRRISASTENFERFDCPHFPATRAVARIHAPLSKSWEIRFNRYPAVVRRLTEAGDQPQDPDVGDRCVTPTYLRGDELVPLGSRRASPAARCSADPCPWVESTVGDYLLISMITTFFQANRRFFTGAAICQH